MLSVTSTKHRRTFHYLHRELCHEDKPESVRARPHPPVQSRMHAATHAAGEETQHTDRSFLLRDWLLMRKEVHPLNQQKF